MNDKAGPPEVFAAPFGTDKIEKLLPHRYPFLLVDRVEAYELEDGKNVRAIKNVTVNEPFFPGHFPGHPVMPGVLIIEAMAQAAGCLSGLALRAEGVRGNLYYLVKVDKAKFNKTVGPGDQLVMEVREKRRMRGMGQFECTAFVDGKKVASAEILCAGKG